MKRTVKDTTQGSGTYKVDFQRLFAWTHFDGKGLCLEMALLFKECVIFGGNRHSKVNVCVAQVEDSYCKQTPMPTRLFSFISQSLHLLHIPAHSLHLLSAKVGLEYIISNPVPHNQSEVSVCV